MWLVILTFAVLSVSLWRYSIMPVSAFLIPVILAGLLLPWRPFALVALVAVTLGTVSALSQTIRNGIDPSRFAAWMIMNVVALLFLFLTLRSRSGLPAAVGESMLMDLRDRLWTQGEIADLPEGWLVETKIASAGGAQFAGDFYVARLGEDGHLLEFVLVDVCGKGVAAGTRALQFSGALSGLLGSLPGLDMMVSANDYMLRQDWLDGFATAVYVAVDLRSGSFTLINAGHPPALHWRARSRSWEADTSSGLALGIDPNPEFSPTTGRLGHGDALVLVTDGVIETHEHDITEGIEWLKGVASEAITPGFDDSPDRIIARVDSGDDDRAVVVLHRR